MAEQFVLDASVVVAWLLDEVHVEPARRIADLFRSTSAVVPSHWSLEVCNAVRKAVRTSRIALDTQNALQQALLALPIEFETSSIERDWNKVLPLALRHELSAYDAAYLEPALRRSISLATFDEALRRAARTLNVACI